MTTRLKISWTMAIGFGVSLLAMLAVWYLYRKGLVPMWAGLVAVSMSLWGMPLVIWFARQYKKRFDHAQSRGCILCSRCEYEMPETQEKVACPECGIRRSANEHRGELERWTLW